MIFRKSPLVITISTFTFFSLSSLGAWANPDAETTRRIFQQGADAPSTQPKNQPLQPKQSTEDIFQQGAGIPTAKSFTSKAQSAYDYKNYKDAIQLLTEALRIDPKNVEAYLLRGKSKLATSSRSGWDDLNQAVELSPNKRDMHITRGKIGLEWSQWRLAADDFKKVSELYQAEGNSEQSEYYLKWSSELAARADSIDAANAAAAAARAAEAASRRSCWRGFHQVSC